jgi:hypothetical protein
MDVHIIRSIVEWMKRNPTLCTTSEGWEDLSAAEMWAAFLADPTIVDDSVAPPIAVIPKDNYNCCTHVFRTGQWRGERCKRAATEIQGVCKFHSSPIFSQLIHDDIRLFHSAMNLVDDMVVRSDGEGDDDDFDPDEDLNQADDSDDEEISPFLLPFPTLSRLTPVTIPRPNGTIIPVPKVPTDPAVVPKVPSPRKIHGQVNPPDPSGDSNGGQCSYIFIRGANKGQQCKRIVETGSKYCTRCSMKTRCGSSDASMITPLPATTQASGKHDDHEDHADNVDHSEDTSEEDESDGTEIVPTKEKFIAPQISLTMSVVPGHLYREHNHGLLIYHSNDQTLFCVGLWDESTGSIKPLTPEKKKVCDEVGVKYY